MYYIFGCGAYSLILWTLIISKHVLAKFYIKVRWHIVCSHTQTPSMTRRRSSWLSTPQRFGKFINTPPGWFNTCVQFMSVVLTAWAVWLTIDYASRKTQIENMEVVIGRLESTVERLDTTIIELRRQNRYQSDQLTELQNMAGYSFDQLGQLKELQQRMFEQNTTLQVNTEPKMVLTARFTFDRGTQNKFRYICGMKNIGGRTAKNSTVVISVYVKSGSEIVKLEGGSEPLPFVADIGAGQSTEAFLNLVSDNPLTPLFVSKLFFKIRIDYQDPLTYKKMKAIFHVTHEVDDNIVVARTNVVRNDLVQKLDELDKRGTILNKD
jgi:hypothetical protein